MDERIARTLNNITDFERLAQFEINARSQNAITDEVAEAIKARSAYLGRTLIAARTGLDLSDLTPAEQRIVEAVSEYVGVMKRKGKDATRTLLQLRNRGLIESAETAVAKAKPTQGFQVLKDENLKDLSYEQIILDHPEEFSLRAAWFARRTLDLPNASEKPPAKSLSPAQSRTEDLLKWMQDRAAAGDGSIRAFANADAAKALGMMDMNRYGRVFGNIVSRVDFGCYRKGLPPMGLTAEAPFEKAWGQGDRAWPFPVASMQRAAKSFTWRAHDFERVLRETQALPGKADLSWKKELAENEGGVRAWAYGLEDGQRQSEPDPVGTKATPRGNPDWTREEHILGLDLYMRLRGTAFPKDHPEVVKLSSALKSLASIRGISGGPTFRNPNGVSMKMMNFRRLDPEYTADGRVGLPSGSKIEEAVWRDFADDPEGLTEAVAGILAAIEAEVAELEVKAETPGITGDAPYWVFVCNPAKWAIDRFLAAGVAEDTWGVRPSDRDRFAPGQLALVRVGVDRRSAAERGGGPRLPPGIYALCEVESPAFPGTGANVSYWADGESRAPGWPTVRIRYLRGYLNAPLTIDRLRAEKPDVSKLLLDGFQAASFPISGDDFRAVLELLDEDAEDLPSPSAPSVDTLDRLAALEAKYLNASLEVKARVSKYIERGPIGAEVKKATGYKCQLCDAMGRDPIGFRKKNGDPYVEAHHVMPVSTQKLGALAASNIMTLCANHHRQIHYGGVAVIVSDSAFSVTIDGTVLVVPKAMFPAPRANKRETGR